MVGWCFFFLLVIIVLGWRERKRNWRRFSEITSRLAQVEELLLEVCSLVEERLIKEELSPLPHEPEKTEKPEEPEVTEEPEEKAQPEKPQGPAELGRPDGVERREVSHLPEGTKQPSPTAMGKRETSVLNREQPEEPGQPEQPEQPERPEQAKSPVSQPKPQTQAESKQTMGRKVKAPKGQNLPAWNQQIIELWQKGLSVQEIARQLEKGQGEVQLIVDLYCDERPQS